MNSSTNEFCIITSALQSNNFARYMAQKRIDTLEAAIKEYNGYLRDNRTVISEKMENTRKEVRQMILKLAKVKGILTELEKEATKLQNQLSAEF